MQQFLLSVVPFSVTIISFHCNYLVEVCTWIYEGERPTWLFMAPALWLWKIIALPWCLVFSWTINLCVVSPGSLKLYCEEITASTVVGIRRIYEFVALEYFEKVSLDQILIQDVGLPNSSLHSQTKQETRPSPSTRYMYIYVVGLKTSKCWVPIDINFSIYKVKTVWPWAKSISTSYSVACSWVFFLNVLSFKRCTAPILQAQWHQPNSMSKCGSRHKAFHSLQKS